MVRNHDLAILLLDLVGRGGPSATENERRLRLVHLVFEATCARETQSVKLLGAAALSLC